MKIIKWNRLYFIAAALSASWLSGCTSVPNVVQAPVEQTPTVALSPEAELAQNLRALPNQYLASKHVMSDSQKTIFRKAITALSEGNTEQAKTVLSPILTDPKVPSAAWVLMGDILLQEGDQAGATQRYHDAVIRNPYNYFALNRLGTLYRQKGQFDTAMGYYQKAIQSWSGYQAAHYNLGILMDLYLGDKSGALDAYANYQALLSHPIEGEAPKKEVRRIKRWIADVNRQLPATANQERNLD